MSDIAIRPFPETHKKKYTVEVPGSKSITNRALLLAALANGKSTLSGVLFSDDSRNFIQSLISLGFQVDVNEAAKQVTVYGEGGNIPNKDAVIYVGSAGTAARFLTAFLGISRCNCRINASEQMKKRPMKELFAALSSLGSNYSFPEKEDFLPVQIKNNAPLSATEVTIDIDKSSQFLSALLISACLFPSDFTVHVTGTHGMAYIDMTVAMMEQFGVRVEKRDVSTFFIPGGQTYTARDYFIEPDLSAACYFYAMAPLLGISMTVPHIPEHSLQGDVQFLDVLKQMGCQVSYNVSVGSYTATGHENRQFSGITADLGSFSDQTMTLAAIAPFANSKTIITGISHIKYQECDRFHAIINELTRVGIHCTEINAGDGLEIEPGTPHSAEIETYDDHRMAMAFSLLGLRANGIVIKNAECCKKTFENYFNVLEQMYE
ncbi:MAG: 3-phosphoshikimate 1-carboxyvinyltransferase [Lachnospiraceae bacterium]|nr:3-phosphoshikimate 1-carboxyvinyltransferase [Lachnospiraceae bacterium]